MKATVIGGGFAGCEAAWQMANRGVYVTLLEMKPERFSPAHSDENLCELVCSNSFKAEREDSAGGLLKAEMRLLGSLTLECAEETRTPAGGALAVDRGAFSSLVTKKISEHPNIRLVRGEVKALPRGGGVVAAPGPLLDGALFDDVKALCGDALSFFDAAAPIVAADTIDYSRAYRAARYGRGDADYINCPMDKKEYENFYFELINAARAVENEIDGKNLFEGCMPIEEMARRGASTLLFGPLRPVGLPMPDTGRIPYAAVQLRQDNLSGSMYNMVGFQTNLKWGEQRRVFSLIPALREATFLRYGVMHRNSFINSPRLLGRDFSLREHPLIFMAGQITGVEGYMESAASGIAAGIALYKKLSGGDFKPLPGECMMGALGEYISGASVGEFQPMNANFGLLPPIGAGGKKERHALISRRAVAAMGEYAKRI